MAAPAVSNGVKVKLRAPPPLPQVSAVKLIPQYEQHPPSLWFHPSWRRVFVLKLKNVLLETMTKTTTSTHGTAAMLVLAQCVLRDRDRDRDRFRFICGAKEDRLIDGDAGVYGQPGDREHSDLAEERKGIGRVLGLAHRYRYLLVQRQLHYPPTRDIRSAKIVRY